MNGGDLNFDCLGFQQRLGTATILSQIYGRHPEWNSPPRRLTSSFDRKNCHSWKGDTRVTDVNEAACWEYGLREALLCLKESNIFPLEELSVNTILDKEPGVDILRPYRKTIGVLSGDTTLVDLSEENEDDEDGEPAETVRLNRIYYNM